MFDHLCRDPVAPGGHAPVSAVRRILLPIHHPVDSGAERPDEGLEHYQLAGLHGIRCGRRVDHQLTIAVPAWFEDKEMIMQALCGPRGPFKGEPFSGKSYRYYLMYLIPIRGEGTVG